MYDKYLLNSLNVPDLIGQSLMSGANMFYENYLTGNKQEFVTVAKGSYVEDVFKVTQDKVHGPFAYILRPLHLSMFNTETLESSNPGIQHVGQCLVGDFNIIEMPIWKHNNNTIVGDIIASMFYSAMNGNLQLATAYLRSSQLFMSINKSLALTEIHSDDLKINRQISLNRL